MLIKLTNTINSIVRKGLSVIRNGLKMWLPFEKSEILGEDLTEGYDFTSGWSTLNATVNDANTFTSDPDGGLYKTLVEVGKTYSLTIEGTTDSVGVQVRNANDSELYYDSGATGAFSDTITFTSTQTNIYVKNKSAGEATITTLKIKEITQIAPDKSGNSNGATLYTGKALSFDGVNDYVDLGVQSNPATNMTFACWLNPVVSASTSYQTIIDYGRFNTWLEDNDTLVIYTNTSGAAVNYTISDLNNKWSRLVVSVSGTTTSVYIDGTLIAAKTTTALSDSASQSDIGRDGTTRFFEGKLSDVQIYDTAWTQDDVTFDYDNPQHLVTDNSDSSIALSNLKGYWHLSEGDGDYAYNSAVALGSEEVTNGDFATDGNWVKGTGWTISSGSANGSSTTGDLYQENAVESGKYYQVTYTISNYVSGSVRVELPSNAAPGIERSANGTYTETLLSAGTIVMFDARTSFTGSIDNVSVKEVSVGEISGATWDDQQATIPQLGLMDWAKSTPVADEITLIADPNDPSKDILGNSVRLREHSLNLDGIGYAEVPDADNLDFGTGAFSMEAWIKVDYLLQGSGGSSLNTILTLGGSIASAGNAGLCVFNNFSVGAYINQQVVQSDDALTQGTWCHIIVTRDLVGLCTLYVNGEVQIDTETTAADITNTLTKTIGVDTNNTRHYQNLIDDVRIYDRALSSDEVEQNYKAGLNKHKASSSFSDDFSSDYGF